MINTDTYFFTSNSKADKALTLFKAELKRMDDYGLAPKAQSLNNYVFSLISELDFEKIFVSITSSDSIFYRFKLIDSPIEFKWEVFFDCEDTDIDIESILHLYRDGIKEKSTFGTIDYIYNQINSILPNAQLEYVSQPIAEENQSITPEIYTQSYSESWLPIAVSA